MEMGRRWTAENLPSTNWILWRWIWRPELALRGFFNMEPFRHVVILHGCAVGGGSITYANTMLVPKDLIWDNGSWADVSRLEIRNAGVLRDRCAHARASLRTASSDRPTRSCRRAADARSAKATHFTGRVWLFVKRPMAKSRAGRGRPLFRR